MLLGVAGNAIHRQLHWCGRQAIARLQQASGVAVSTLLKLMVDPTTPASTRARAADSILDHGAKAIELEDIEARLAALEQAAENAKDRVQFR